VINTTSTTLGGTKTSKVVMSTNQSELCIAFENGNLQISVGIDDIMKSIIVDSGLNISNCRWNYDGTVLAVSGTLKSEPGKTINAIKFFNKSGNFLRMVKIPGTSFPSFSWEGSGLRLALAVDAYIFFANVRPAYNWCAGLNSVVYSYYRPEKKEPVVVFWDTISSERYVKYLSSGGNKPELKFLKAAGDFYFVVIVEKNTSSTNKASTTTATATATATTAEPKKDTSSSSSSASAKGNKFDDDDDEDDDDIKDSKGSGNKSSSANKTINNNKSYYSHTSDVTYTIQVKKNNYKNLFFYINYTIS